MEREYTIKVRIVEDEEDLPHIKAVEVNGRRLPDAELDGYGRWDDLRVPCAFGPNHAWVLGVNLVIR